VRLLQARENLLRFTGPPGQQKRAGEAVGEPRRSRFLHCVRRGPPAFLGFGGSSLVRGDRSEEQQRIRRCLAP
jgi:hypothetical protein